MSYSILSTDDEITVRVGPHIVAAFSDLGNGMDGAIEEGDNSVMTASQLIEVARWILMKAADRASDEENRP